MGYAVKKDGSGWRAVNSKDDIDSNEKYQDTQPDIINTSPDLSQLAMDELNRVTGSSGTIMRCVAAGIVVPPEWSAYVKALRNIANGTDQESSELPARPLYPVGS